MSKVNSWIKSGAPWVWLNAAAVSCCILLVLGLMLMIAVPGFGHFWPSKIHEIVTQDDQSRTVLAGQIQDREEVSAQRLRESGLSVPESYDSVRRYLIKVGNRDLSGQDFVWVPELIIAQRSQPLALVVLEREEWGNFYGYLLGLKEDNSLITMATAWEDFQQRLERTSSLRDQISDLEKGRIGSINYRLERLRLRERRLELKGEQDPRAFAEIEEERVALGEEYELLEQDLLALNEEIRRDAALMRTASGEEVEIPLYTILDAFKPNTMGLWGSVGHFFKKSWQFIVEDPREANTEGGIFPAIYGTVMMVLLMSVFVTPFGVVAAVYLKEYARQGLLTRIIRVAVNNLAGVPSIVYGVFGLGFFIYTLGGSLDRLFFPEALPSPTFGTGGLFWASLTLALLTLPVVIVSTEEGLARIPRTIREGSLALGATRWETLWRTVLPMASPGIMTGMILAVARAAGEVAPLMLVGVVKLAPSLPLDGNYPFLHPERKFMHLGFHIYDVGFQSPNVEAARPLVYATALLLVCVTVLLNLTAIRVRNRLREKYRGLET
ncbi:MAG: phosphate ABC transporter permease PstA [Gammaproteobacteria bacterium]|nr:phosphate ABC transporter permease PstA [Gammaproteobacteria bacterium]